MLSNTYKQKTRSYLKYTFHQKTENFECTFYDELKVCAYVLQARCKRKYPCDVTDNKESVLRSVLVSIF